MTLTVSESFIKPARCSCCRP